MESPNQEQLNILNRFMEYGIYTDTSVKLWRLEQVMTFEDYCNKFVPAKDDPTI